MDEEIKELKMEKKQREMERNDKETIDELIKKNQEYREESDRFLVAIYDIRKKLGEMEKQIKVLERDNARLLK